MALKGRSKYDKDNKWYFITTSLINHENIFSDNKYCEILVNSLKFLTKKFNARIYAYVIMSSHIHLIVFIPEDKSISDFMRDFKTYTAKRIIECLKKDDNVEMLDRLKKYSIGYKKQQYKVWEDRFDDVILYTEKVFKTKMSYIHNNPVNAGLVKYAHMYKYSSAWNYYYNDDSLIEIERI